MYSKNNKIIINYPTKEYVKKDINYGKIHTNVVEKCMLY